MLELIILSVFPAAMAIAAASDLFSMKISNRICIIFACTFVLMAFALGMEPWSILMHTAAGLAMLVLGFGMFAFGWIGGGDAKLFAATAAWVGWAHLIEYALWISLVGGALTLMFILMRTLPLPFGLDRMEWANRLHSAAHGIPYGIALSIAGLLVYPSTPWFNLVMS